MLNEHYDVVVVGTGNAALCSAIAAKEKGANILVVEKGPKNKRGGNSFFTDGAIRLAYRDLDTLRSIIPDLSASDAERIDLPDYTETDFYDDMMRVTKGKSKPELAQTLVSKSLETIRWMKENGVEFQLNENQSFETEDGKLRFWGGLPLKTKNKGIGLVETLFNRLEQSGVEISYSTRAIKLVMENGEISGIVVEKDGDELTISTKSVVLACGGFEASKEKRKKFIGTEWENAIVRGSEFNTGDGLEMAIEAGAQLLGDWAACHAHTTDYGAPSVGDYSKPGDIYKKSSYPLGLIVNTEGERFVDEGADFRNYTYAKYGKEILKQPGQKAFQLFDDQVRSLLRQEYNLEEASCLKADSLEELADKMEVDSKSLVKTIESYNNAVQEGKYDPSIKDGKNTAGIVPPKSNWALRFEKKPFYAYPVTCGITFTFGGIMIDELGNVLNQKKQTIPGLFAAGEMVGGLFYHNYPGGSGLMSGAVFGKIAGESANAYAKSKIEAY